MQKWILNRFLRKWNTFGVFDALIIFALDINSLSENGLHTNKKIFCRHLMRQANINHWSQKDVNLLHFIPIHNLTLTHSEHLSKHGTKWKLFGTTPPIPFIWASKRIFHVHDGLLTFSQASPIKMKIGIAKGEWLLKWNHFEGSFYMTNHAHLLYNGHFLMCTLVIFFPPSNISIFAPATHGMVPN
jgi:hypothetical protein